MAFPESFLSELAEKNDIEDVVSAYVRLTKRSGQNVFGLCPFHNEKTPSFSVSPSKQIYHCFGCGKGGSVFNFIMDIENLSFPEAVEFLAKRVGMAVPEQDYDKDRPRRERIYALNKDAAMFFHEELQSPVSREARDYIVKRGISPSVERRFGLGYAPDSWDLLIKAMEKKGYSERELIEAGLAKKGKKGGAYDAFRKRIIFPIIDIRGNVVAFSGRILGDGEPKYLNSPETPVFSKSHNLFGLNLAKKTKLPYMILVEGNVDVLAMHQAGFDNAVASLGTSLTPEQARLLSRFTSEIVLAYDMDEAGNKAAGRAISLLEKLDLKVRVLRMEGAKDPDEYIKKFGTDALLNLLSRSENHIEYKIANLKGRYDLDSDEGKVAFLKEATDLLADIPAAVEREVYILRIASICAVPDKVLSAEVARRRKRKKRAIQASDERRLFRPATGVQPKSRIIKYKNPRSALAEEGLIRLLFLDPLLFSDKKALSSDDFSSAELGNIFSALMKRTGDGKPLSIAAMSQDLSADEFRLFSDILQKPESSTNRERALTDYFEIIKNESRSDDASAQNLRSIAERLKEKKGYGVENGREKKSRK